MIKTHMRTILASAGILLMLLLVRPALSGFGLSMALELMKWTALTVSWYIFSGLSGYPSLAHGAFFGVGAYLTGLLWPNLPLAVLVILGGLLALVVALIIGLPILKVRGPYFVVLTLGLNLFLLHLATYMEIVVLGSPGRMLLGIPSNDYLYAVMAVVTSIVIMMAWIINKSRLGRGLLAIRLNEETAMAIGVPVTLYKWLLFGISAGFAGATGSLFALRWTYIEPATVFDIDTSFMVVIMSMFGGQFSLFGPIFGAIGLSALREILGVQLPRLHLLILGVLLMALSSYFPAGLHGLFRLGFQRLSAFGRRKAHADVAK